MSRRTNTGFGAWLINLDQAGERRARMTCQLDALGIPFERFSAIDGRARAAELFPRVDVDHYERHMGHRLLPGRVGCYFSHLAVWKELAASDHPVGLIMEDDVVFHDDFPEALALALEASAHWDLLRLNSTRAKFPVTRGLVGRYRLNAYLGRFTGNGCYLLKRDVAIRLIPRLEVMKLAFEYEIGRFFDHDYRQFGLEPFPSHIDDGGISQTAGVRSAELRKLGGVRRLTHIRTKMLNYGLRIGFLARRGGIFNSREQLIDRP